MRQCDTDNEIQTVRLQNFFACGALLTMPGRQREADNERQTMRDRQWETDNERQTLGLKHFLACGALGLLALVIHPSLLERALFIKKHDSRGNNSFVQQVPASVRLVMWMEGRTWCTLNGFQFLFRDWRIIPFLEGLPRGFPELPYKKSVYFLRAASSIWSKFLKVFCDRCKT